MRIFRAIAWLSLALPGLFAQPAPETEIVLARCNENISWVGDMGYGSITTVYEKCGSVEGPGRHVPRPNVGREGGTYLQHIVDRYDSLADWTIFSQAGDPTYGYRGHRLGGGHMMRNVRFQDYVEAASRRATQPRFYIFTTILAMRDWTMFQCIRRGYGEGYLPDNDHLQDKMCGRIDDWTQWFEFPDWFKDMVIRLQEEQHAPFIHFKLEEVLKLFDFKASHNLIFFAQGARFAISKEAIRMRPKSYYENLLPYFATSDPWVGYFMEWLWWYVLSGAEAPCGFEAVALSEHYRWAEASKGRMMIAQTSGTSGAEFNGNTNVNAPQVIVVQGGDQVIFLPRSKTTFNGPFNVSGEGSVIATNGATIVFNQPSIIDVVSSFNDSSVLIAGGASMDFTGGDITVKNCTLEGSGPVKFKPNPKKDPDSVFFLLDSNMDPPLSVDTQSDSSRRTSLTGYATAILCGSVVTSGITLSSTSALELQENCQVTGQPYSNTINTLTPSSGAILAVTGVSSTSLPTLISTITDPSALKLEVVNTGTGTYTKEILQYGTSSGSCYNGWSSATIDGCPDGSSCSVAGQTNGGQCTVVYSQTASSGGGGSDTGLLGLLALLALIPICAGLAWFFAWRASRGTESAFLEVPQDYNRRAGAPTMANTAQASPTPVYQQPPQQMYAVYPAVMQGSYKVPYVGGLAPVASAGPSVRGMNVDAGPAMLDSTPLPSPKAASSSRHINSE